MFRIICHTNLDVIEVWPTRLPAIPRIGERIQSKRNHGVFQLSLEVVSVEWRLNLVHDVVEEWYAYIELHDPLKRSITEFYEWYAPLVGKSPSYFI